MKIKKGKLNYDQSGRAYPPNPRVDENWSCLWEYEGKYYKLVGDNEHKEWDEVNIYNQIINEAYENYVKQNDDTVGRCDLWTLKKEEFINICKTNPEFSEKWGLKIEERKLNLDDRAKIHPNPENFYDIHGTFSISDNIEDSNFPDKDWLHEQFDNGGIPTKLITLKYNNEKIESYE